MVYLDLDKIINITGGGSGGTFPEGSPYPVLGQTLGLFNKDDAWDSGASEGWFGLLNSSIGSINAQNNAFNTDYSLSTTSGTGALTRSVKSYPFSANISTINSGRIQYGLFAEGTNTMTFDQAGSSIDTVRVSSSIINSSEITGGSRKGYISVSGGNRYLVVKTASGMQSFPVDANNEITGGAVDTVASATIPFASIGGNVWAARFVGPDPLTAIEMFIEIYSVSAGGAFTLVDSNSIQSGSTQTPPLRASYNVGAYISGNTARVVLNALSDNGSGVGRGSTVQSVLSFGTVDLSSTGTVSYTSTFSGGGTLFPEAGDRSIIVGFDGTDTYVVNLSGDILPITGAGLGTSLGGYYASNGNNIAALAGNVSSLTTAANNISVSSSGTSLNTYGSQTEGTYTGLLSDIVMVHELDGVNDSDSAFFGAITNGSATGSSSALEISVNGELITTKDNLLSSSGIFQETTALNGYALITPAPDLEITLSYANAQSNDVKLGFGITGGNYATPTGANDLSGSATTAWSAGANATFISLTLEG